MQIAQIKPAARAPESAHALRDGFPMSDDAAKRGPMAKHTNPAPATDEQVRALLERYKCPVPFHEVRTRFLGNVATPVMSASPIKTVKDLWGGELPAFDSIDAANDLIGALIMGLWNRLTRHQDRNAPFRLLLRRAKVWPLWR
jgi:hypothetical protein